MVGFDTLPRRMTGLPAINPSLGFVRSFSSPTLFVSPGALSGHSANTGKVSATKTVEPMINEATQTTRERVVDFILRIEPRLPGRVHSESVLRLPSRGASPTSPRELPRTHRSQARRANTDERANQGDDRGLCRWKD